MFGHFQQTGMIGRADHDRIDIARQNLGRVANRLGAAELHLGARQEQRLAAELAHADIEGDAGAGGGLFEDHRQHLAGERLVSRAGLVACLRVFASSMMPRRSPAVTAERSRKCFGDAME